MNIGQSLYVVTCHDRKLARHLQDWCRSSAHNQCQVQGHRLYISDDATWQRFCLTWTHGFTGLHAWDNWNRRSIDLAR